jgi:hypothetical protein
MKITITFDELDLKDNLVLSTINTLFNQNKAIVAPQTEIEDLPPTYQQKPLKSTENTQKSKGKTKEERITELKKYANSIWADLSDAKKKSLKSFVAFYEKKIKEQDFNINPAKQFSQWWQNDKNNR